MGPALPAPGRPDLPAPVPAPGPAADASAAIDVEILTDEGISQTVRGVEEEIISIGRSAENRIVLPNPAVSRRHAEILREESGLVLHNFSVNGALVGEREVPEDHHEPFELGEEICIGPFRLTCRPARAPSRTGRGPTAARAQLGPGSAPVPPPGQALMRAEPRSGPASVVQRPEQATGQRAAVPAPHAGSAEPAISVRAELLSQGGSQVRRPPAAVPDRRSHQIGRAHV